MILIVINGVGMADGTKNWISYLVEEFSMIERKDILNAILLFFACLMIYKIVNFMESYIYYRLYGNEMLDDYRDICDRIDLKEFFKLDDTVL